MIKTNNDILYNKLKNSVGFVRSKKFKKWFHEQYPGKEMHHVFGSYSQSIKTTDYCSIPVNLNHTESDAEKDKSNFAIENLDILLSVMIQYIIFLERKK